MLIILGVFRILRLGLLGLRLGLERVFSSFGDSGKVAGVFLNRFFLFGLEDSRI